jgi:hypothetical protein
MQRACDIGKKRKLDPVLRRYVLSFAVVFTAIGLVAGYYAGLAFAVNENTIAAPQSQKLMLTSFIAVSGGAAGLIFGAFIGSTIYRFKEKKKD